MIIRNEHGAQLTFLRKCRFFVTNVWPQLTFRCLDDLLFKTSSMLFKRTIYGLQGMLWNGSMSKSVRRRRGGRGKSTKSCSRRKVFDDTFGRLVVEWQLYAIVHYFPVFSFIKESFVYIAFLPLWITLSNLRSFCMSLCLFGCLIGSSSTNQQYFPENTALAFRHFQKAELSSTPIIRSHTSRIRKPLVWGHSFLG